MIRRISKKRSERGEKYQLKRSPIKRSTKRIRALNPKAKAKRKVAYRKMLRSKEYLAAKAEALVRAGDRCEWSWFNPAERNFYRCDFTWPLEAHHVRYPKTRPLNSDDLLIVCKFHHERLEGEKMHKTRMF